MHTIKNKNESQENICFFLLYILIIFHIFIYTHEVYKYLKVGGYSMLLENINRVYDKYQS